VDHGVARAVDRKRVGMLLLEPPMLDLQRFAAAHFLAVTPLPLAASQQVHAEHQTEHEDEGENDILVGRELGHGAHS
jgi:hypothetical protein